MTWRTPSTKCFGVRRLLLILLVLALPPSSPNQVAADNETQTKVAQALDSLRGVDLSKLSDTEKDALGKRLDDAWKVILDNRKESKPAVRAALAQEQQDSFRIIDLAHLLLVLDSHLMDEASAGLLRADPNGYPDGYFSVASGMAAMHCEQCLPVVLKMLELKKLETSIPEHALPVDLELGLIFSIGQYGNAALEGVSAGLNSQNCVVRANSALALGQLLPAVEPVRLNGIALNDSCEESRNRAWMALGDLDSPGLSNLAGKRLASDGPLSNEEKKAIASGLSLVFFESVVDPLRALAGDSDPQVSKTAKEGLEEIEKKAPELEHLREKVGSGSPSFRSKVEHLLKKAKQGGFFEFEGHRDELLTALTPNELPLLNEARAAVLCRISDEGLDEYADLTYAARVLRAVSGLKRGASNAQKAPGAH